MVEELIVHGLSLFAACQQDGRGAADLPRYAGDSPSLVPTIESAALDASA
jgi:hypothetical protein